MAGACLLRVFTLTTQPLPLPFSRLFALERPVLQRLTDRFDVKTLCVAVEGGSEGESQQIKEVNTTKCLTGEFGGWAETCAAIGHALKHFLDDIFLTDGARQGRNYPASHWRYAIRSVGA